MAVDQQSRDSLFLPSQFVSTPSVENKPVNQNWPSSFPSSDFGSLLSSPSESDFGSTESESDQDDEYIAELTRRMAHYMLQDDDNKHEENWTLGGSPKSTLRPQHHLKQKELAMVEKLEELNITEEDMQKKVNGEKVPLSGKSLETTMAAAVPLTTRNSKTSSIDFHSKHALIDQQIRAVQFCSRKHEQINKQRQQECVIWGKEGSGYQQPEAKQQFRQSQGKGKACAGFGHKQKISGANLQWQQRNNPYMKAIFLGKSGSNYGGSNGTGVFLPRGIGNTSSKSRKKQGCSTVLIPARVVQALKLHFDKMGVPARLEATAGFLLQHEAALQNDVNCGLPLQQIRQSQTVPAMERDIGLPKEWTY